MYKLILSICFSFLLGSINGQELITTNSGQKILVHKDGTWTTTERDAAIDQEGELTTETTTTDANVFEIPTEPKATLTEAQSSEIQNIISLLEEKEGQVAVSIYQGERFISKLKDSAVATDKEDKKRLQKLIKEQKKTNDKGEQFYAKVSDDIISLRSLSEMEPNEVNKKLGNLKSKIALEYTLDLPSVSTVASQSEVIEKLNYATSFKIDQVKGPKIPFECEVSFDGKDPISGKKKREIAGSTLFTFTQDKLKPYFKQDDFLTCESMVTKVGKNYYVTLTFSIKSKDASRTYGSLKAQEEMRIEFINGGKVYGTNIIQSNGEIEPYSGNTIFTGVYQFDKDEIDQLGKKLIDNVGVLWSSGFEQYDVYNVDLLMHQIICLKKG